LPGESLSKYARVRAVEPEELEEDGEEEEVPAQEAAVSTVGAPTPEAVAAQQEEAVLAEVKEHLAEIAREDEEMRDFEEAERLAYEEKEAKEDAHGDSPERIEVHVSAAPVETLEVEDEDEGDDAEPSTPKESGVEEGAFEEVVAAEGASEDAAEAESGVLPAMGYSAHLRQADQRFLQQRSPQDGGDRGGRRRRRGGRGRDRAMVAGDPSVEVSDDSADTADEALSESLVTEASATEGLNAEAGAATAVEALPNESRRERRGGRDRGERGDRGERHGNRSERTERTERHERSERGERRAQPSITELLKEGQEVLVQIAKEPLGQKGARITSHIALPGRYCVYMPTVDHTGVSRKIGTDEERSRLKKILLAHSEGIPGGFIIRTAGEGRTEDEIKADIEFLHNLWMDIRKKAEAKKAPALIYHDLEIVERVLRDQLGPEFKSIWVDNEEIYESILRFLERFQPQMVSRVKMYTRQVSIFDSFGITQELEKALRPKVWLKSGGYIVINQTEALVAIDINTGKFVGRSNKLEDTIVKTNIEAIKEIVRQIRLRDLGGIIVIDFIDMDERKNRMRVMQALEEAMRADRAPYKILQFNDFGLVAITRKRVKQSLERTLCAPCPYCEGSGYVKSVQTVVTEIVNEAKKLAKALEDSKDVLLRVNPEVAKVFKSAENQYLEELEEILGRPVMVVSDALIHQEKFDLA
jgi:ribonuclease G